MQTLFFHRFWPTLLLAFASGTAVAQEISRDFAFNRKLELGEVTVGTDRVLMIDAVDLDGSWIVGSRNLLADAEIRLLSIVSESKDPGENTFLRFVGGIGVPAYDRRTGGLIGFLIQAGIDTASDLRFSPTVGGKVIIATKNHAGGFSLRYLTLTQEIALEMNARLIASDAFFGGPLILEGEARKFLGSNYEALSERFLGAALIPIGTPHLTAGVAVGTLGKKPFVGLKFQVLRSGY